MSSIPFAIEIICISLPPIEVAKANLPLLLDIISLRNSSGFLAAFQIQIFPNTSTAVSSTI
jgi:hypothetical protein